MCLHADVFVVLVECAGKISSVQLSFDARHKFIELNCDGATFEGIKVVKTRVSYARR